MLQAQSIQGQLSGSLSEWKHIEFLKQHVTVPPRLRSKGLKSTSKASLLFHDLLCVKLRLGRVDMKPVEYEGRTYYAFRIKTPGRSILFACTPLCAYVLGMYLSILQLHGYRGLLHLSAPDEFGHIYIPQWARQKVVMLCRDIVRKHEHEVQSLVDEIHRQAFLGTEPEDEQPKDERILH